MRGVPRKLPVLAWLVVLAAGGTSLAQPSSDRAAAAEALFREGKALMGEGRLPEACEKLAASQKMDPALGTLMNLADCHERSGKTASAWAEFLNAATQARRAGQADRASVAESRAAALEPRLCRLLISVPAGSRLEGLEIRRDGVAQDAALWNAEVPIDQGAHHVTATAPGRMPWSADVEVVGEAKTMKLEIPALQMAPVTAAPQFSSPPPASLAPVIPPVAAPVSDPPPPSGMHIQTTLGLVVSGLGLVGIGAGSYFGLSARSKWNDANCPGNVCPTSERQGFAEDAKSRAQVSTVAFVGGGVLLASGIALVLTAPTSRRGAERSRTARSSFALVPSAGRDEAGIAVTGRF